MEQSMHEGGKMCKCPHHKAVPMAGFLIGLFFLLQMLGILGSGFVSLAWPVLLMAAAGSKLGMCKCCA